MRASPVLVGELISRVVVAAVVEVTNADVADGVVL
jgi:hypothetical protein